MVAKADRDKTIEKIIKALYDANAHQWSVQDKGTLLAAVKLALKEGQG